MPITRYTVHVSVYPSYRRQAIVFLRFVFDCIVSIYHQCITHRQELRERSSKVQVKVLLRSCAPYQLTATPPNRTAPLVASSPKDDMIGSAAYYSRQHSVRPLLNVLEAFSVCEAGEGEWTASVERDSRQRKEHRAL